MIERGILALVVGPSGVGKDSLIAQARTKLADDPLVCFPSRVITRPVAGPESHVALSACEFDTAEAHGAFFLSWRAHGVAYGIPRTVIDDLQRDCIVVANVSRAVITAAYSLVRSALVVHVTAPRDVLLQRLASRGREPAEEIVHRLDRAVPLPLTRVPVIEIDNSGPFDLAALRLIEVLRELARAREDSVR